MSQQFVVSGNVFFSDDRGPVLEGRVAVYDRDLPSLEQRGATPQLLGESSVDANGRFSITYTDEQFRKGEGELAILSRGRTTHPDLSFRIFDRSGQELTITRLMVGDREFRSDQIIFHAPPGLEVAISVQARQQTSDSEYERLLAAIAPVIDTLPPAELTEADVAFLINELSIEQQPDAQQRLQWLRRSALLAVQTDLPIEAFYGWGRKDHPARFSELTGLSLEVLPSVLKKLLSLPDEDLRQALREAITENIIPAFIRERVDEIVRRLKRRDQVLRSVTVQLQDQDTGSALAGCSVTTFDEAAGGENRGLDLTDQEGRFSFEFYVPAEVAADTPPREFRLEVHRPNGEKLEDGRVSVQLNKLQTAVISVPINVPKPELFKQQEEFKTVLLDVPSDLKVHLTEQLHLKTLADIRRMGGLHQLRDLPGASPALIERLESFADLDRITAEVSVSSSLLDQGFDSVLSIADTPLSEFSKRVRNGSSALSEPQVAKLHFKATIQTRLLNNLLTEKAAHSAMGFAPHKTAEHAIGSEGHGTGEESAEEPSLFPQRCGCSDCEAAVSPAAYLTALLVYTLKHVRISDTQIDLNTLSTLFHQPIGDLPTQCEAVEKRVRQVRLCLEVLRSYLGPRPLADPVKEITLATTEADYLFAVYSSLLNKIGTSYEEIRRAQTESEESRQVIAERLGIDLTKVNAGSALGDEFSQLLLDATGTVPGKALTEQTMETVFGISDTTRDPLSEAAKLGDDFKQITRWNLDGAIWGQHTDHDGVVYVTVDNPSANRYRLQLFRDQSRTQLVASGEIATAVGAVRVLGESARGLSGSLEIAYTEGSSSIAIAAVPRILSWQLKHLRTLWNQQDHPIDGYSKTSPRRLPIIDPDLIGPDDFRNPIPKTNASDTDRAFDLWLKRRAYVDTTLNSLKATREASGLRSILTQVFGNPLPNFDGFLVTLTMGGSTGEIKTVKDKLTALGLSVEGFVRLMAIRAKDQAAQSDFRNEKVTDDEWREAYSILVQAIKITQSYNNWLIEEQESNVDFGRKEFWFSLRAPQSGDWPPVARPGLPLIDPDVVKINELPEWLAGKGAHAIWKERKNVIEQIPEKLRAEQELHGFDSMVRWALGHPSPGDGLQHNLDTLKNDLRSSDKTVQTTAVKKIEQDLLLSIERFNRLIVIKDKHEQSDIAKKPIASEYAEVYAFLTPAHKIKHKYPGWIAQEAAEDLVYWKALKAKLPRWRASIEARQAWQQALRLRSERPLIDPTVIGPEDLQRKTAGDPVFDIWKVRYDDRKQLLTELTAIRTSGSSVKAAFDRIVKNTLVVDTTDLEALEDEGKAGHSIEKRLEQLNLSYGAFTFLMRIQGLVAATATVANSEWELVNAMLAGAKIERMFSEWRTKEQESGIILSSDHFTIAPVLLTPLPLLDPSTPVWLSTWEARRIWQDSLQSRIDQENSLKEGLHAAISAVEEATLPSLREALVTASDAPGADLSERAKWLTERLSIDAQAGSCQITTRVAQAIESIQALLFSLRTGQFKHAALLALSLHSDHFDEEWKWIGSYEAWRGAMFVQLYPENTLYPTLRKYQTPGFATLVDLTRSGSVDPQLACGAAQRYSEYYRDVCSLEVQATSQCFTHMYIGEKCSRRPGRVEAMSYMFGRAASGKIYWSAYHEERGDSFNQTPWMEVPGLENIYVSKVIGAIPYTRKVRFQTLKKGPLGIDASLPETVSSYIYLFCLCGGAAQQSLKLARLNLQEFGKWEANLIDLTVPPFAFSDLEIVPVQTQSVVVRPGLVFHVRGDNHLYHRSLSDTGLEWDQNNLDWSKFKFLSPVRASSKVEAALRGIDGQLWIVQTTSLITGLEVQLIELKPSEQSPGISRSVGFGKKEFVGALPGPVGDSGIASLPGPKSWIYLFWKDGDGVYYRRLGSEYQGETKYTTYRTFSDLITIPPHCGSSFVSPIGKSAFVCKRKKNSGAFYLCQYRENVDKLMGSKTLRIVPRVDAPLNIPSRLSVTELQSRREAIIKAYAINDDASSSILNYLEEAYYCVPLHLAISLETSGHYQAALDWFKTVRDYESPPDQQNIFYGLELDAQVPDSPSYELSENWLLDPLNPHLIGATRRYTKTRFTLMTIVRCLLDFADAEFTHDTPESVVKARIVYLTALDLLSLPELHQSLGTCDDLVAELTIEPGKHIPPEVAPAVGEIVDELTGSAVSRFPHSKFSDVVKNVKMQLNGTTDWEAKVSGSRSAVQAAMRELPGIPSIGKVVSTKESILKETYASILAKPDVDFSAQDLSGKVTDAMFHGDSISIPGATLIAGEAPSPAVTLPIVVDISPSFQFCIPPNPMLKALRMHAELNLSKLRSCRNIAGMKRELDMYRAPTNRLSGLSAGIAATAPDMGNHILPTVYPYSVLIERAKQLAQLAGQMESSMLSALEKMDLEAYNLTRARQDMAFASAGAQLQTLRVSEASDSVRLAEVQKARAQVQLDHYALLLSEPVNELEKEALLFQDEAIKFQEEAASRFMFSAASSSTWSLSGGLSGPSLGLNFEDPDDSKGNWQSALAALSSMKSQRVNTLASYERRQEEWKLLEALASQDIALGSQQVKVATDQLNIALQEKTIAQMQYDSARDNARFLETKFTSVDLYDWMSGLLKSVYRFFLQQARVIAKLGENQLRFERQVVFPDFIREEYWLATSDQLLEKGSEHKVMDRAGLTGSARLLHDIYQLDQYAFASNIQRLQLTKIISLADRYPAEFERFKESGQLLFRTPMDWFDRDFPGHYIRLIRRVKTSVIALIPPARGIHATLSTTGLSRTVIGPEVFQMVSIKRDPQHVALTSPFNSTGLFELNPVSSEMLFPFEGGGVDTTWEFRMPRAANQFDYRTIADVLITIEYTALNSSIYEKQVVQSINPNVSADRAFSFRNYFADQWYDLHNPEQVREPMTVRFRTSRPDFPPNLETLRIQHLLFYLSGTNDKRFEIPVTHLRFREEGQTGVLGGGATTIDRTISTRRGNAGSWTTIIGKSPIGEWELSLPNTEEVRNYFKNGDIQDILFVITYSGRTSPWPEIH